MNVPAKARPAVSGTFGLFIRTALNAFFAALSASLLNRIRLRRVHAFQFRNKSGGHCCPSATGFCFPGC
jgi:hypothetical protein